jgi:hypothetical protein
LATVNDAAENDWIVSNYANRGYAGLWIGLTDKAVEGVWRWVSGEPVTYLNWHPQEPNNATVVSPSGEDFAHLWGDTFQNYAIGKWNDSSNDAFIWSGREFVGIAEVTPGDREATGTLTMTGISAEGGVLTASLTNVVDADGATTTAYRWQENVGGTWTNLSGQTASTLSIPSDQSYVGKSVRVVATTTDVLGGTTEFASAAQAIANVNDAPTGLPSITGTAVTGGTLTANTSAIVDADGVGAFAYVWKADGAAIASATSSTLVLGADQVGKSITVEVRFTDVQGTSEVPLTSASVQVADYLIRGNSRYLLVYGGTWEQAQIVAQSLGGNLATVNDAAENDWIVSNYANRGYAGLWIGLTEPPRESRRLIGLSVHAASCA